MLASCRFPYSTTFPPVAVSGTGRSDMAEPLHLPPLTLTADGARRRVGVEIEFAGLESREAAQLVQDLYGGRIEELDPQLFEVRDTRFGTFVAELDLGPAHGPPGSRRAKAQGWLERGARTLLGEISKGVVPTEVAAPPVPIDRPGEIDDPIAGLRRLGATGTDQSRSAERRVGKEGVNTVRSRWRPDH